MRLLFWRKPMPEVHVDLHETDATRSRKKAEARWPRVEAHNRSMTQAAAHAVAVLEENHFTQRARHALEGRS